MKPNTCICCLRWQPTGEDFEYERNEFGIRVGRCDRAKCFEKITCEDDTCKQYMGEMTIGPIKDIQLKIHNFGEIK